MNLFKRIASGLIAASLCTVSCLTGLPTKPIEAQNQSTDIQCVSGVRTAADNALGKMLLAAAEDAGQEQETDEDAYTCAISAVDLGNGYADVSLLTNRDATLIVALHDEKTDRLVTSASAEITEGTSAAHVTFSVMPEDYFVIRAYLVEPVSYAPLSEVFENLDYTEARQTFYTKTADDFDAAHVLQCTSENPDDLIVFSDEAIIVPYSESQNQLTVNDTDNGRYVIENADDTVKSLKSGDVFVLYCGEEMPLMVKIDTVTADGSTVTVTEGDTTLEEMFAFIRIDSGWVEPEMDSIHPAEGVSVRRRESSQKNSAADSSAEEKEEDDDSPNFSFKKTDDSCEAELEYTVPLGEVNLFPPQKGVLGPSTNKGEFKAEGKLAGEIAVTVGAEFHIHFENGNKMMDCGLTLTSTITPTVKVEAEVSAEIPLLADEARAHLAYGFCLFVNPSVQVEAKGEAAFEVPFEIKVGFDYDSKRAKPMRVIKTAEAFSENGFGYNGGASVGGSLSGKFEGFIGINVHPGIEWLKEKILSAKFDEYGAGLQLTLETKEHEIKWEAEFNTLQEEMASTSFSPTAPRQDTHLCRSCVSGELSYVYKIAANIEFAGFELPKIRIEPPHIHLMYFYCSQMDESFKPRLEFGLGKCPHQAMAVSVNCLDWYEFHDIKNAVVTLKNVSDKADSLVTVNKDYLKINNRAKDDAFSVSSDTITVTAPCKVWLPLGTYTVSAEAKGYDKTSGKKLQIDYVPSRVGAADALKDAEIELAVKDGEVVFSYDAALNDEEYELKCVYDSMRVESKFDVLMDAEEHTLTIEVQNEDGEPLPALAECTSLFSAQQQRISFFTRNGENSIYQRFASDHRGDVGRFTFGYSGSGVLTFRAPIDTYPFRITCDGYKPFVGTLEVAASDNRKTIILEREEEEETLPTTEPPEEETVPPMKSDEVIELMLKYIDQRADSGINKYRGKKYQSVSEVQELDSMMAGDEEYIRWSDATKNMSAVNKACICRYLSFSKTVDWYDENYNEKDSFKLYLLKPVWEIYLRNYDVKTEKFTDWLAGKSIDSAMALTNVLIDYDRAEAGGSTAVNGLRAPNAASLRAFDGTAQTASFQGLVPGGLYNFYCLASLEEKALFDGGNLLAMTQTHADADGNLTVSFVPAAAADQPQMLVAGPQNAAILTDQKFPEEVTLGLGETYAVEGTDLHVSGDAVKLEDGVLTAVQEGEAGVYSLASGEEELLCIISVLGAGSAEAPALGVVNEDGDVNAADAAAILIAAANLGAGAASDLTDAQAIAADVDQDGTISANDAASVLMFAAASGAGETGIDLKDFT